MSRADFIAKMSIASKEARETHYWLRLLRDSEIVPDSRISAVGEREFGVNPYFDGHC